MNLDTLNVLRRLHIEGQEKFGEFQARCPFHAPDRHPSWSINLESRVHKCFSCGASGNIYSLAMHVLGVGFATAKEWVDRDIKPPEAFAPKVKETPAQPPKEFKLPEDFQSLTMHAPEIVRAYANSRGLTEWQWIRWNIGYAISGRLRGRLIVPIKDDYGKLSSYVARTFVGDDLRYLTPRFDDGADFSVMFGQEHWPRFWDRSVVYVTESAIDALAIERSLANLGEVPKVVAIGGSQVTLPKLSLLHTFQCVVVCTDADDAGDAAALSIQSRHRNVIRLRPRNAKDAAAMAEDDRDDWLKHGIAKD